MKKKKNIAVPTSVCFTRSVQHAEYSGSQKSFIKFYGKDVVKMV